MVPPVRCLLEQVQIDHTPVDVIGLDEGELWVMMRRRCGRGRYLVAAGGTEDCEAVPTLSAY